MDLFPLLQQSRILTGYRQLLETLELPREAPITLGWGYPINPDLDSDTQNFFFSFGTTF